jgi:pyridoxal phosphate enzyme (YggS family)
MTTPPTDTPGIAERLARVRAEIDAVARAAGRTGTVTLIAVSKTHPVEAVAAALLAGQIRFGENRVREAAGKFAPWRDASPPVPPAQPVPHRPILHIIGPVQTNKARDAVRIADVIESLDRPRLADALAEAIAREGRAPDLLVQVNTGREPQKAGVAPEDADRFIDDMRRRFGDRLRGLMCVPPAAEDPAPHFIGLARMAERHGLGVLSMGMSADWRVAVRCGATQVRLGSAVFGPRPPAEAADPAGSAAA